MLPTLDKGFHLSRGIGPFIQRRAWRILPPYYFALILSIAIDLPINHKMSGPGWDLVLPVTRENILSHVLLFHNFIWADMYKINGAFWSIPVEWQIYFVFPLLLLGWRKIGPLAATVAALAVSVPVEHLLNLHAGIAPTLHFIGLFALGMAAAYIVTTARYPNAPWRLISLILASILGVTFYTAVNQIVSDVVFGALMAAVLVVVFFHPEGWLHRGLTWKPLVSVGLFSYSLYLVHAPIMESMWVYGLKSVTGNPNLLCVEFALLSLAVTVPCAWLFHLCCERPFLQIRERKVVHIS
jgi:peptidoglycan/LPS O-acetylase OafA/YrhL